MNAATAMNNATNVANSSCVANSAGVMNAMDIVTVLDGLIVRLESFSPERDSDSDSDCDMNYFRHEHRSLEMIYVTQGRFELCLNERSHLFSQNMFVLVPPGVFHASRNLTDDLRKQSFTFELAVKDNSAGPDAKLVLRAINSGELIIGKDPDVIALADQLSAELTNSSPGGLTYIKCLMQLLLLALMRHVEKCDEGRRLPDADLNLRRSIIIDEFFSNSFYLSDGDETLSLQLGVSKRQSDRILKRLYGKSYRDKLSEKRLVVAEDLLFHSGESIAAISERLGYSYPSSFITFVRKQTGKTPAELRREFRLRQGKDVNNERIAALAHVRADG